MRLETGTGGRGGRGGGGGGGGGVGRWFWGLLPLGLVAVLSLVIARGRVLEVFRRGVPPVEQLAFERVTLAPGRISAVVVNGGAGPVAVAQVMVDDAFWQFTARPSSVIPRLGRATIELAYPWVQGESHRLKLLTSSGLTFEREIAVAVESPRAGARFWGSFTLIGLYVGVLPVAIGLVWLPFLRSLERRWLDFALALTAGLLLFLGWDAVGEALEAARQVAGPFQGPGLVALAASGTLFLLQLASGRKLGGQGAEARRAVAWLVALGIGLHNLGEGLAIGAAYALGEVGLGALLVVGFMLHNSTEGLAIAAPVARDRPRLRTLAALGLVAGAPTVLGAWIGGLAYSPLYATVFLAAGAGAIAQVLLVLYRLLAREAGGPVLRPLTAGGVVAGMGLMYATGLLVAG